jgi:broad specificity phosphatase PhoE
MPPTLILIRHAEALHNASKDYHIPDAELSEKGKQQQCIQLKRYLQSGPLYYKIQALIASPAKRTVQTALLAFDELLESRSGELKVELDPEWQGTYPISVRSEAGGELRNKVKEARNLQGQGSHPLCF